MNARWSASLLVVALALAVPAAAQEWSELDEGQRAVLAPWRDQWDELPGQRRQRLLEGAERWQAMSPDERDEVRRRLQAWNAMTPEEQARIRERMERFRGMPDAERDRVREGMQRLRKLPPEQRQRLRQRWEEMTDAERRAFLGGLALGDRLGDRANERGWTGALTPDQRNALVELGEELDRIQRWALRAHLRSLPDARARADYARRLIEADAETRASMIAEAEQALRQRRRAR